MSSNINESEKTGSKHFDLSEVVEINGLQLSILSPEQILNYSVVPIDSHEINEGSNINIPKCNGINDPRMGPLSSESQKKCPIDDRNYYDCPGYFGHIVLAKPVFWPHYMDHIITTLKYVCTNCSSILIDKIGPSADYQLYKASLKLKGRLKAAKIKKITPKKICPNCSAMQPSRYWKEQSIQIVGSFPVLVSEYKQPELKEMGGTTKKIVFTAEKVKEIFSRITDEDIGLLGYDEQFSRPEWMICSVFPVPPPCIRPSVRTDANQRSEDDLTHKGLEIIKVNNEIINRIEKNQSKDNIEGYTDLLQYHVATYVNNDLSGIQTAKRRSGGSMKSVIARLKGKGGRIRQNLMGKRVDYSARSVITPDPMLSIEEVGVPFKIAKDITIPEMVTKYNIDKLTRLVRNGPNKYPGAIHITEPSKSNNYAVEGKNVSFIYLGILEKKGTLSEIKLREGMIVRRHMMDGDIVLFNRQPSLHKMSMMAHRVRVLPGNTFRIQLAVVTPYNADFDGDEMNMHVPQSIHAAYELEQLCSVSHEILSPQSNEPCIGINQDGLIGAYLLVQDDVRFTKYQFMNLMMWNEYFTGRISKPNGDNGLWTGKQAFSSIVPYGLNYKTMEGDKVITNIHNGELVSGNLDKDVLGPASGGLVHILMNDYNTKDTRMFLDSEQRMVRAWLLNYSGFSISIRDCLSDEETEKRIKNETQKYVDEAYELLHQAHEGIMQLKYRTAAADDFEVRITEILNKVQISSGNVAKKDLDPRHNHLLALIKSKSKGKPEHISQIMACLGQQNLAVKQEDGTSVKQRIPYNIGQKVGGFNRRTLNIFNIDDDGPIARGFCRNSLLHGLNPAEFWFHNVTGREGLTDTAIKTSETGYIHRKMSKSMEDAKVYYDGTVRGANKNIIQFVYGDDANDSIHLEKDSVEIFNMDNKKLAETYRFTSDEEWHLLVSTKIRKEISQDKNFYERMEAEYHQMYTYRETLRHKIFNGSTLGSNSKNPSFVQTYVPFNMKRLITNAKSKFIHKEGLLDINPVNVIDKLDAFFNSLEIIIGKDSKLKQELNENMKLIYKIIIKSYLSPKRLIKRYRINKNTLDYILEQLNMKITQSLVQPGEMVGIIAAHSMGAPCTQMTLNTFHSAGIAAASNLTTGVPRLRELIQATKSPKGPSMTIYLKGENRFNLEKAEEVKNNLHQTSLKDVVSKTQIVFDPSDTDSIFHEDDEFIQTYYEFMNESKCNVASSPWLLRIELDKWSMMERGIKVSDIYDKLYDKFNVSLDCIFSDDNAESVIFRIRINPRSEDEGENEDEDVIFLLKSIEKTILDNINLKGINNIANTYIPRFDELPCVIQYDNFGNLVKVQYDSNHKIVKNPDPNGKFEYLREYIIVTDGTNLNEILQLPDIDQTRTISNHIVEVYDLLGIEATRELLIREIYSVITFQAKLDVRHISLLVDTMTNKGNLMSIDRFGISRGDVGPLGRSTFEQTEPQFTNGAVYAERDNINGVSANIMMGQYIEGGTGYSNVFLDEDVIMEESEEEEEEEIVVKEKVVKEKVKLECDTMDYNLKFSLPEGYGDSSVSEFKMESVKVNVI